jgi:chemotaxis protein MotB
VLPDKKQDKPGRGEKHDQTVVKRSSRKHHDEGHGGAWKVAFADFCLALMCLFLVMWVMAAREQEHIKEVMRAPGGSLMDEGQGHMSETMGGPRGSLIDRQAIPHFTQVSGTGKVEASEGGASSAGKGAGSVAGNSKKSYESPADLRALSQELARLSVDQGLSSNLQTVITAYGLRVMVHDTDKQGMFERGSSVPTERFRRLLRRMGPLFAQMSNQMLIVGHTDSVQYADKGYAAFSNWTLSSDRAMVARSNLLSGGMPSDSVLQVVGMADRAPMDATDATAGVNRRIELLILTSAQARSVSTMFGLPENVQPLNEDVDSALPDRGALQSLRAQIIRTKGSPPDAD